MKIYDISVPILTTMPTYPGDPAVTFEPFKQIGKGSRSNVSRLSLGDHTGTHFDPPLHFIPGGKPVDQLDLNVLCGLARVLDFTRVEREITPRDLERARIPRRSARLLFKTRSSELWDRAGFQRDYVGVGWDAAEWLVERGIKLVGVDYLSVETYGAAEPKTHRTLLGAGVIIVEGLNLHGVPPGKYTFVGLPLKIQGGDGAPGRAILMK
jgi:arylformamidase